MRNQSFQTLKEVLAVCYILNDLAINVHAIAEMQTCIKTLY